MTAPSRPRSLLNQVWNGSIPLEIRLASEECRTYDQSDPYLIQCPRVSYWPFLLPRIHSFFATSLINPEVSFSDGWLSFEDVPLKWQYPMGLLYDLYAGTEPFRPDTSAPAAATPTPEESNEAEQSGALPRPGSSSSSTQPWKLVLHFTDWPQEHLVQLDDQGKHMQDAYINAVKEADFLRNGSAKVVMSLSKQDSTTLYSAVQDHSLQSYYPIYQKFLKPPGGPALRHVPLKLYMPSTSTSATSTSTAVAAAASSSTDEPAPPTAAGMLRIVQTLVTPLAPGGRAQNTLGAVLNTVLPALFPSRRRNLLAEPVLHGAVVPLAAPVEELLKEAAYADGWLHVVVSMMG
ncbi:autophagy protein 5 [Pseudovirgaria hyperparasitica]|uniref:Autophagy protein 5 n=1 Tax=Pseudovirgaria hyperparasitica TaxID=470096 RepID=A0A6A6W9N8_9PEZI|nr:autophagy protein 5 [Pseudovirgaria hyperparasitica]KAF2759275.1 autophagy protein 5 [Pseudovirgaria hyperparasitica]